MAAQCIDEHGPLTDQQVAHAMMQKRGLLEPPTSRARSACSAGQPPRSAPAHRSISLAATNIRLDIGRRISRTTLRSGHSHRPSTPRTCWSSLRKIKTNRGNLYDGWLLPLWCLPATTMSGTRCRSAGALHHQLQSSRHASVTVAACSALSIPSPSVRPHLSASRTTSTSNACLAARSSLTVDTFK